MTAPTTTRKEPTCRHGNSMLHDCLSCDEDPMTDATKTTPYKRFRLSRAYVLCILYLTCFAVMFGLNVWRWGLEDAYRIINLIVLAAIAVSFCLEHLHHLATRKRYD